MLPACLGRRELLAHVRSSLIDRRWVTLVGPSGMGKSLIARHAVADREVAWVDARVVYDVDGLIGAWLQALNPECHVIALQERLEGERLLAQVVQADVVLDCCDNFATRHAVNRACVAAGKPLVSGAAIRFDGRVEHALLLEVLTNEGVGTMIRADDAEAVHPRSGG